jgi:preprotein translocase subunit SecE
MQEPELHEHQEQEDDNRASRDEEVLSALPEASRASGDEITFTYGTLVAGLTRNRGVGSTVNRRSPKPFLGVRIPPPLPNALNQKFRSPRWKRRSIASRINLTDQIMAGELEPKKTNWIENTRSYLSDIRSEMKRVTWPNRDRVQSTTLVVIVSVFIFATYFEVVDTVLQKTIVKVEQSLTK